MPFPDSMCVLIACCAAGEIAGVEGIDDRAMLAGEVLAALEPAAADHLHHQVHRQLAIDVREHLVAGEIDLELVERGVGRVPLLLRDRRLGLLHQRAEAVELRAGRPTPTVRSAACSSSARRTSYPSTDGRRRHRRDVVAAARLDREQALRDEARQRVVHRAARDAELGRELVQAQLRARARVAAQHALPQRLVDLLVEVRAREHRRH